MKKEELQIIIQAFYIDKFREGYISALDTTKEILKKAMSNNINLTESVLEDLFTELKDEAKNLTIDSSIDLIKNDPSFTLVESLIKRLEDFKKSK